MRSRGISFFGSFFRYGLADFEITDGAVALTRRHSGTQYHVTEEGDGLPPHLHQLLGVLQKGEEEEEGEERRKDDGERKDKGRRRKEMEMEGGKKGIIMAKRGEKEKGSTNDST